jgi:hypothetical protein
VDPVLLIGQLALMDIKLSKTTPSKKPNTISSKIIAKKSTKIPHKISEISNKKNLPKSKTIKRMLKELSKASRPIFKKENLALLPKPKPFIRKAQMNCLD